MRSIIITSPHAQSTIHDAHLRDRIALDDYWIWKCSDPFTGDLEYFPCAEKTHISDTHRLVCDMNRSPDEMAFHETDFFGKSVFKEGAKYTPDEKQDFLKRFWWPFHNDVEKSVLELDQKDEKKIFIIDYHNTSGDHLLGPDQKFMPAMVISNLYGTTFPQNSLYQLKTEIEKRLPIPVVLNDIYHGGFDIQWFSQISERKKIQSNLYCIQIEYNLDFIHNPLSHGVDLRAKKIMETALNEAIEVVYDSLPSAKEKMK